MAFQEVKLGNSAASATERKETIYPRLKDVQPNTVLASGIFTGSHEGQFGRTYYVEQDNGIAIGLGSSGKLRALIDRANLVPNQSRIRVTYLGKVTIAEGKWAGQKAHDFKLEVDSASVSEMKAAVNS